MIQARYYVDYNGEIITLKEFARRTGVRYSTLQGRAARGADLFSPISQYSEEALHTRHTSYVVGGYTLEELSEMYMRFRGAEDELDILADLACLRRHTSAVVRLKHSIEEYLEHKRMEAQGK